MIRSNEELLSSSSSKENETARSSEDTNYIYVDIAEKMDDAFSSSDFMPPDSLIFQSDSLSKCIPDLYPIEYNSIDMARESLFVETEKRSEIQLELIFLYLNEFKIFNDISHQIKMDFCAIAEYRSLEANHIFIYIGDIIDSLYVVMSGKVVSFSDENEQIASYGVGDSFGLSPLFSTPDELSVFKYSTEDSCELMVINRKKYERVMIEYEEKYINTEVGDFEALYDGNLIVTATANKLIDLLFDDKYHLVEPNFVIDFFLVSKIFLKNYNKLIDKIKECLRKKISTQRVVGVLFSWLTYCPQDFTDSYLQDFISFILLELRDKPQISEAIVQVCAKISYSYEIKFTLKGDQEIPIRFKYINISPPYEYKIRELYITHIDPNTEGVIPGLQLFDEVILINDLMVKELKLTEVQEIINTSTSFIFIVRRCQIKYNYCKNTLTNLFEMNTQNSAGKTTIPLSGVRKKIQQKQRNSSNSFFKSLTLRRPSSKSSQSNRSSMFVASEDNTAMTNMPYVSFTDKSISITDLHRSLTAAKASRSINLNNKKLDHNNNNHYAVSVYNKINECKYYYISRLLTCKKLVEFMLIQNHTSRRFNTPVEYERILIESIKNGEYYIFIIGIINGIFKKSRLGDTMTDIPSALKPGIRLYVAKIATDIKISQETEDELYREYRTTFMDLDDLSIAKILTITDFYYFTSITSKEYLDNCLDSPSLDDPQNLLYFERRCNNELRWTILEILSESQIKSRAKIITKFITIAIFCLELGNYNSFFSIICGLEDNIVSRLKLTWELVSQKIIKLFNECKILCHPKNNMSSYRSWLRKYSMCKVQSNNAIIIPSIPLLKKDLFFINESYKSFYNKKTINYRKMRLLAKELRKIFYFTNPQYSIGKAFDIKYKYNVSILEKPSLIIGMKSECDNVIHLSNVSSDILNFMNRAKSNNTGPLEICEKKNYDEAMLVSKVKEYLKIIDNIKYDYHEMEMKSYQYETPPQFILDSFDVPKSLSSSSSIKIKHASLNNYADILNENILRDNNILENIPEDEEEIGSLV